MTTLTVGTGDAAEHTGDLIVTFVDLVGTQGVTTDGTRTALPGAPWGCYLVAPSISAQPGAVVTFTPASGRWESCSLLWAPPAHSPQFINIGGSFSGAAGVIGNPKFPATTFPLSGRMDAAAGVAAGTLSARTALAGRMDATAGILARANVRAVSAATASAAGGVGGDAVVRLAVGGQQWFVAGTLAAAGSISGRAGQLAIFSGTIAPAAGVSGNATRLPASNPQQYDLGRATLAATSGFSGDAKIVHQFAVSGLVNATTTVIPFGGNASVRVSNYITDPRPEAVVSGSPGTIGQWDAFSDDLTRTVIGTGTESQIPYIDLRFSNASSGGGGMGIQFEQNLNIGPGTIWSLGAFVRIVGGSTANVTQFNMTILSSDSGGVLTIGETLFTPTTAGLATQWFTLNNVFLNDPTMTTVTPGVGLNYNAGAVDITLRIGGARLEKATAASGPQYIVVPKVGNTPSPGTPTTYVY